jgi:hypothetical protein
VELQAQTSLPIGSELFLPYGEKLSRKIESDHHNKTNHRLGKYGNNSPFAKMTAEKKNLRDHWDQVYLGTPDKKLGWHETDRRTFNERLFKSDCHRYKSYCS